MRLSISPYAAAAILLGALALSSQGCAGRPASSGPLLPASQEAQSARPPRAAAPLKTIPITGPYDVAVDAHDNLYVSNHYPGNAPGQILIYDSNNVQQSAETIKAGMSNPQGLAFDASGNLYVAQFDTNEVDVYDTSRKLMPNKTLHLDTGKGYAPSGVQVDSAGDVWVANRSNAYRCIGEIEVFNSAGAVVHRITQNLEYPIGIIFQSSSGDAWVDNAIACGSYSYLSVYNSTGAFQKFVPTGSFIPNFAAFDAAGNVYATDALHNEVEVFSASGSGDPIQTITAGLDMPYGIAFNSKGDFYIANVGSTVTEYNAKGKLIATLH